MVDINLGRLRIGEEKDRKKKKEEEETIGRRP